MSWSLVLLAFSLSMDAAGVSLSYSLKKIRIPWRARLVVGVSSCLYAALGLWAGAGLSKILPPVLSRWIGIAFLGILGTLWLLQAFRQQEETAPKNSSPKEYNFVLASLGITVHVLANPLKCDLDGSRHIDKWESFLLGFVLSVDAIVAGLSLSLSGNNNILFPLLSGICQVFFLSMGIWLGEKGVRKMENFRFAKMIPGAVMLCLCALRIIM